MKLVSKPKPILTLTNTWWTDVSKIELLLSAKEQIESKVSFSRRGSIQLAHLVVNPHILSCEDDNRYGMVWRTTS